MLHPILAQWEKRGNCTVTHTIEQTTSVWVIYVDFTFFPPSHRENSGEFIRVVSHCAKVKQVKIPPPWYCFPSTQVRRDTGEFYLNVSGDVLKRWKSHEFAEKNKLPLSEVTSLGQYYFSPVYGLWGGFSFTYWFSVANYIINMKTFI